MPAVFGCAACSSTSATPSPSVSEINLNPSPCIVRQGKSLQLTAMATMPDGTKHDVTSESATSWSTENVKTATVNKSGILVGVSLGVTKVRVSYKEAKTTLSCTVTP